MFLSKQNNKDPLSSSKRGPMEINKMTFNKVPTKLYYPRPTLVDLLLEE